MNASLHDGGADVGVEEAMEESERNKYSMEVINLLDDPSDEEEREAHSSLCCCPWAIVIHFR